MKKNFVKGIVLSLLLLVIAGHAQPVKYSNDFMAIGVGSRAFSMGHARVAGVEDLSAGYYNPAGLANMPMQNNMQVQLMHNEHFGGIIKYDYAGVSKRIDSSSVIALNMIRSGTDDIPNTLDLIDANNQIDYNRVKSFSVADYGFLLSYGRKSKVKNLTYGVSAKVIRRIVGSFANAWGFGLDAGMQYKIKTWYLGLSARDITGTFNAWNFTFTEDQKNVLATTGNVIPQNAIEVTVPRAVFAFGKRFDYKKFSALTEINLETTFDGFRNTLIRSGTASIDPRIGVEFSYANMIFLRGGLSNIQEVRESNSLLRKTIQSSIGIGVRIKMIHLDYALANVGQQVGLNSNVFTLRADIDYKK
ncbi:MAG: hypothetical protein ACK5JC_05945 [Bacteroidota bacterium]|jgi:hypothetical protein